MPLVVSSKERVKSPIPHPPKKARGRVRQKVLFTIAARVRAALGEALPWQRAGRPPAADELTGAAGGGRRAAGARPALSRRAAGERTGQPAEPAFRWRTGAGARLAGRGERPGRHPGAGLRAMAPRAPAACSPRPPGRPQAAPRSPRSPGPTGGRAGGGTEEARVGGPSTAEGTHRGTGEGTRGGQGRRLGLQRRGAAALCRPQAAFP